MAEDSPVVIRIMSASLPAIEERSIGSKGTFAGYCRSWFEQVYSWTKKFIRERQYATTEGSRG